MTVREHIILFETLLQQLSPDMAIALKPDSFTILEFLNLAVDKYVDAVYTGTIPVGGSFEQTQLNMDSLRALVKEDTLTVTAGGADEKPNSYTAAIPTNYLHAVSEEVEIEKTTDIAFTKRVGVTECTSDTYTKQVEDPYSEHRVQYEMARPLRLYKENVIEFITDGTYQINECYLRYLKTPTRYTLEGSEYDLPLPVQKNIVEYAVSLFVNSFGGQKSDGK
jgi:hypothetical protein